jgi:hypothetical protein
MNALGANSENDIRSRIGPFIRSRLIAIVLVLIAALIIALVIFIVTYQPLTWAGGSTTWRDRAQSSSRTTYETLIVRDLGLLPVSILSIGNNLVSDSKDFSQVGNVALCTLNYKEGVTCTQSKFTGLPVVRAFRAFNLHSNETQSIVWRSTFTCPKGLSVDEFVTVPIRLHYLWFFTKTVNLTTASAFDTCLKHP